MTKPIKCDSILILDCFVRFLDPDSGVVVVVVAAACCTMTTMKRELTEYTYNL